jgi:hypothetical protein
MPTRPVRSEMLSRIPERLARCHHPQQSRKQIQADGPDQVIDNDGDEAAADAGQRHLDRNQLRGIDVKLVFQSYPWPLILSNQWLQKRRPYWERLAKLLNAGRCSGGLRPVVASRTARNRAALPPGGQRPVHPAPGPHPRALTLNTSISYWLAPTISSIPAGATSFRRILRFSARRVSGLGAAPDPATYCCRWDYAVRGRAGHGADTGASAVHAPDAGSGRWWLPSSATRCGRTPWWLLRRP